jgi:hypothetical protein
MQNIENKVWHIASTISVLAVNMAVVLVMVIITVIYCYNVSKSCPDFFFVQGLPI